MSGIRTKKYEVSGKSNFRIVSIFLRLAYACPLLATRDCCPTHPRVRRWQAGIAATLRETRMTFKSLCMTPQGIAFSIRIEDREHSCLITGCALKRLYAFEGTTLDFEDVFRAYESEIHGVARKLISNGEAASPLVLQAPDFNLAEA
jgi:hypothetical protein